MQGRLFIHGLATVQRSRPHATRAGNEKTGRLGPFSLTIWRRGVIHIMAANPHECWFLCSVFVPLPASLPSRHAGHPLSGLSLRMASAAPTKRPDEFRGCDFRRVVRIVKVELSAALPRGAWLSRLDHARHGPGGGEGPRTYPPPAHLREMGVCVRPI